MQTTATISKQQQIDQVRRDFKQSWTSDRRPDFLTYLSQVDKPLRGKLCVDLLAIDIKLRRKAGQTVESADYRASENKRLRWSEDGSRQQRPPHNSHHLPRSPKTVADSDRYSTRGTSWNENLVGAGWPLSIGLVKLIPAAKLPSR